jgi:hypothetical protein
VVRLEFGYGQSLYPARPKDEIKIQGKTQLVAIVDDDASMRIRIS